MNKTRVLLIIPNLGKGGAQRVYHQQLDYLSAYFNVQGCVFNWDGAFEEDKRKGIISLEVPAGSTWIDKAYYFSIRIIRLRKIKKRMNIEVTISHLEGADYVNLLSRSSDKVICWIHGTKRFDANINGVLGIIRQKLLMPFLYKRSQKIVTVSKGIEHEFRNAFKRTAPLLQTVYNGFDVQAIQQQMLKPVEPDFVEMANAHPLIITHGRLALQKNSKALIHIFKEVKKKSNSKLIIIGDGDLREELIKECEELKLKTWLCWSNIPWSDTCDVYFLGQQSNPFKYLCHASLYAMTSSWEGFPLALCEAMVCNLTIIASDCYTGPREILAPELTGPQPIEQPYRAKYGELMPLINHTNQKVISVWAAAVYDLVTKGKLTKNQAEQGVNRIKEFDIEKAIQQTISIIQSVK
jgi:glycosyltransferase involved in cell wall biosynthesis